MRDVNATGFVVDWSSTIGTQGELKLSICSLKHCWKYSKGRNTLALPCRTPILAYATTSVARINLETLPHRYQVSIAHYCPWAKTQRSMHPVQDRCCVVIFQNEERILHGYGASIMLLAEHVECVLLILITMVVILKAVEKRSLLLNHTTPA